MGFRLTSTFLKLAGEDRHLLGFCAAPKKVWFQWEVHTSFAFLRIPLGCTAYFNVHEYSEDLSLECSRAHSWWVIMSAKRNSLHFTLLRKLDTCQRLLIILIQLETQCRHLAPSTYTAQPTACAWLLLCLFLSSSGKWDPRKWKEF